MNVTHDEILALFVMKDRKIIGLELQLQLAHADSEAFLKSFGTYQAENAVLKAENSTLMDANAALIAANTGYRDKIAEWQKAYDLEKLGQPMDENYRLILILSQPPLNYAMDYLTGLKPEQLRELAAKFGK